MNDFRKVQTQDLTHSLVQDNIGRAIQPLLRLAIANGNMVLGQRFNLAPSGTLIRHGLGRVPLGYFLTHVTAQAQVWDSQPATKHYLVLSCSAAVTGSLWVF